MKTTIAGIVYDTERSRKLAHKTTVSSDTQLFQTPQGDFFLVMLQIYIDGRKLGPNEYWLDLRLGPDVESRLKVGAEIQGLTHRQALEWAIKTQIPATLRGYLLESI